ncbi:MAG: indole-3-glycerol phosphate synthase TrpC, partial [Pseudomonadota bacterium]|nr:indole-3-glycerol phosphate synthase TrpC [Pseudomonadota bacterium]
IASLPPPKGFTRGLKLALKSGSFGLIAEIKKASPSRGLIREEFDPSELAKSYSLGGATCLSILTETNYFQGENKHLQDVRSATDLPLIRKDFIIDPYQVAESRAIGADCILIIMAAVSDILAGTLFKFAQDLGMDVLVEVHNRHELERSRKLNPKLLGINNRNLKTLGVDLSITEELAPNAPKDAIIVSESGINSHSDIRRISAKGVNCFLVGESLMRQTNVTKALKTLIGTNKQYRG